MHGTPRLHSHGIVPCVISFSRQQYSLVSLWCDHSMPVSLLWQSLIVSSLLQLCWKPTYLFSLLSTKLAVGYLSQSFHLKGVKTSVFILSKCPAFTAVRGHISAFISRILIEIGMPWLPYFLQWCHNCLPSVLPGTEFIRTLTIFRNQGPKVRERIHLLQLFILNEYMQHAMPLLDRVV